MAEQERCPACDSSRGEIVYHCSDIPVQSCVMLETADEARRYPLAELRLFACHDCGFLANVAFDYEVQGDIGAYEGSQAFSARFTEYQQEMCEELAAKHALEGKHVLEYGCGQGDFLRQLCEVARCRGTGFDPILAEDRVTHDPEAFCQLRKAAFGETDLGTAFDLFACRHTLEHVARPAELVETCRAASRASHDAPVFFEVPDVRRILEGNAFWDIYYEHCSYFSMGSLARLFRRCGMTVTDLKRVYDEQYLVITARPARPGDPTAHLEGEDDLEEIKAAVEAFRTNVERTLSDWRDRLQQADEEKTRIALWGSGSKAAGFLSTLGVRDQIPYIVDINPRRQGLFQAGTGQEIVAPDMLQEFKPDLVIIMNSIYRDEIEADLRAMGLAPEILAL